MILLFILCLVSSTRAISSYRDRVKIAGCQNPVTLAPEMTIIAPASLQQQLYSQQHRISGEDIIITVEEHDLQMVFNDECKKFITSFEFKKL